jgi:hypothetical protein
VFFIFKFAFDFSSVGACVSVSVFVCVHVLLGCVVHSSQAGQGRPEAKAAHHSGEHRVQAEER